MKDLTIHTTKIVIRKKLENVIKRNLDAFAQVDKPLGATNVVKYHVHTG